MTPLRNGGETFRIEFSGSVRDLIEEVQGEAIRQGRGELFVEAMKEIVHRLSHAARTAGEPQYRLPALRLRVRTISIQPVTLHYAVSEDRPVVYVKLISLMT